MEGGVEVSLGGWCVSGAGEQDGLGAFPQLLDTMLPDVCSKHVICFAWVDMAVK